MVVLQEGIRLVIRLHEFLGYIIFGLSILLLLWNLIRVLGHWRIPSFKKVLLTLLDWQILIGIIAFVAHPIWGQLLLHPLIMIVAVVIAHKFTKEKLSDRKQLMGYLLTTVLLLAGISVWFL